MVAVLFPQGNYVNLGDPEQVAEHASSLEEGEAKETFLAQAEEVRYELEQKKTRPSWRYYRHDYSRDACVP